MKVTCGLAFPPEPVLLPQASPGRVRGAGGQLGGVRGFGHLRLGVPPLLLLAPFPALPEGPPAFAP